MKLSYLLLLVPILCWSEPTSQNNSGPLTAHIHQTNPIPVDQTTTNIVEINDISEIMVHLNPDTKYILDLDETIFRHAQTLGGRRWVAEHMQQLTKNGMDHQAALDEVIAIFCAVQEHTKMVPMQEQTPGIIKQIHDNAFGLLALTARGEEVRTATERHLQDLGKGKLYNDEQVKNHLGL